MNSRHELEAVQFWYKTPQEKNILLMQQTTEERRKKMQGRSRWADLSMVVFPAFNPDKFLTQLYSHTRFIYTPWFTTLTLMAFALTAGITVTHWREIGRDTGEFYNFANKTWGDIFILYSILLAVVVVHEFAHAYVSKHFGARVLAMGFALIYLTPALYTDTTEADVMSSSYERFVVTIAGVWSELMICAMATFIWWGTVPDTPDTQRRLFHDDDHWLRIRASELESADEAGRIPHAMRGHRYPRPQGKFDGFCFGLGEEKYLAPSRRGSVCSQAPTSWLRSICTAIRGV